MIARLLRLAWLAAVAAMLGAAWGSIRWFGPTIGPLAAGLAGAFAVCALHPAAIAINFAMSRLHGDPVPAPLQVSPWGAIRMFDAELDASMRGFWFATPFLCNRPAPEPDPPAPVAPHALLFVHGYFCNRAIWTSFMRDAAARGHVCDAVTLDEAFASIDRYAAPIDAALDALLARARELGRPARGVVVVAHSMGGLAIRAALQRIDASRVAHVVTLGTPHRGTWAARFGTVENVRQMRLGSPWLAALDAAENEGARGLPRGAYTTVCSLHDDMVYPQRTALLDGAHAVVLGGIGHVALAYDRHVRRAVFGRLATLAAGQDGAPPV